MWALIVRVWGGVFALPGLQFRFLISLIFQLYQPLRLMLLLYFMLWRREVIPWHEGKAQDSKGKASVAGRSLNWPAVATGECGGEMRFSNLRQSKTDNREVIWRSEEVEMDQSL